MSTLVRITTPRSDEGTIVCFNAEALGEDGEDTEDRLVIAVDHRPARDILEALAQGEEVIARVESWQILSTDGR